MCTTCHPKVCGSLRVSGKLHRCSGLDMKTPMPGRCPRTHRSRWAGGVHGALACDGGLSEPGGLGRPSWRAQHWLCTSMRPRALPRVGLCLGGRRQGRLTPGGLRALAPAGLWALTGWEIFTSITSNQYWGYGFIRSCQKTTIAASKQNLHLDHCSKPFRFPLPRCREI